MTWFVLGKCIRPHLSFHLTAVRTTVKSESWNTLTELSTDFELRSHCIAQDDFTLTEIPCLSLPNAVITDMDHYTKHYIFITNRKLNNKKRKLVNRDPVTTGEDPEDPATYYKTKLIWILEEWTTFE